MPKSPTKTKMNLIEVNTLSPSVDVLQQTSGLISSRNLSVFNRIFNLEIASSENLSKMQSSLTDVTDIKEESEKLAEESCSQVQVDESSGEKAAIIKQRLVCKHILLVYLQIYMKCKNETKIWFC